VSALRAPKNPQDAYSRWWQQQAAMQQEAWAAYYAKQKSIKLKKKHKSSSSSSSSSSNSSGSCNNLATKKAKRDDAKRQRADHDKGNEVLPFNAVPDKARHEQLKGDVDVEDRVSALGEVAEAEGASAADDFEELDSEMLAALLKPRKKRWDVAADKDMAAAAELYEELRRNKPLYGIQLRESPRKLAGDCWEEPRVKIGLDLLGWLSYIPERWTYPLQDESRRSFAGYLPGLLPAHYCHSLFHTIWHGTKWLQPTGSQGLPIPRKTAWMISQNCTCRYRYGGMEVDPELFPPWMVHLMQTVMPACGLKSFEAMPNSCNLNLYEDGTNSVGWHADDEQLFQGRFQDCRIISLSLGARRRFELRLNWPEKGEEGLVQIMLGDGDLCTMEGMTQKHFQHRVAREAHAVSGPRINLTWRWIAKHSPDCPARRYRPA